MKKIFYILFLVASIVFFNACDIIGEDNRFLELEQVEAKKNVLLVEFTDQSCVNCPRAAEEIARLKGIYGDTLVTVSMHASLTGNYTLITEDGNNYERYFETNKTGHPVAIIDGRDIETDIPSWGGLIRKQLSNESPVAIKIKSTLNDTELSISSEITAFAESVLKYQLWLTEDSIVNYQKVSSSDWNYEYVHNHVFRAAVNGTWGESLVLSADEEKSLNHSFTLNDNWRPEKMHIIAFVFNDNTKEVFQVTEIKINQ